MKKFYKIMQDLKLAPKLILSYIAMSLLVAAIISISLFSIISQKMQSDLRQRLIDIASLTAGQIDGDSHAALVNPGDVQSPAYEKIRNQLIQVHKTIPGVSFAYTLRQSTTGDVEFIVDDDSDPYPIGTIYPEPGPIIASHIGTLNSPITEDSPYTDEWGTWLTGYAPIIGSNGALAGVVAIDISYGVILEEQRKLALICVGAFSISFPLAWLIGILMTRYIVLPLQGLTKGAQVIADHDLAALNAAINQVAQGDLQPTPINFLAYSFEHKRTDEIGQLSTAFNHMIEYISETGRHFELMTGNLRFLVGEVTEKIGQVNQAATQLNGIAIDNSHASKQISTLIEQTIESLNAQDKTIFQSSSGMEQLKHAVENVARGAYGQAASINHAALMSDQIAAAINRISISTDTSLQTSLQAAAAAEEGTNTVALTIERMHIIKTRVDETAKQVSKMGEHSENISQMVEAIEEIASQTNLLALNAAIEAARVGDTGKGFAVVADEVRKLAEKSANSAHEISNVVKNFRHTLNDAVHSMEAGAREVGYGVDLVDQSGKSLANILSSSEAVKLETNNIFQATQEAGASIKLLSQTMINVNDVVGNNMAATEQMAAISNQLTGAIESVVETSRKNSMIVQNVAKSADQMALQSEELNISANNLTSMAHKLENAVEKFVA